LGLFQAEHLFFLNSFFQVYFVTKVSLHLKSTQKTIFYTHIDLIQDKKFSSVYSDLLVSVLYKHKFSFPQKTAANFEKRI
jgi:hypothetical protein